MIYDYRCTIIFVILVVLVICLLLYVYKYENFNVNDNNCKFLPWGESKESCITSCMSNERIGLWDETGEACNSEKCSELCSLCESDRCKWVDTRRRQEISRFKELINKNKLINRYQPKKLVINCEALTSDENPNKAKIKVEWNKVNDSDGLMIHYYKLGDLNNKINVINLNNESLSSRRTFEIKNLMSLFIKVDAG